jgi:hypothetical protein
MFTIIHKILRLSPAAVFGSSASYGARQRRHLEPASPRDDDWSAAAAPGRGSGLAAISPPRAAVRFDGDSRMAADSPKLFQSGGMVVVTGSPVSPSAIRSSSSPASQHHHHYQQQRATAPFHHIRQQQHPSAALYDDDEEHHNNGEDSSHVVNNSNNNRSSSHNNSSSSNNLPEDLSMGGKEDVEGTGGGRHQRASIEH